MSTIKKFANEEEAMEAVHFGCDTKEEYDAFMEECDEQQRKATDELERAANDHYDAMTTITGKEEAMTTTTDKQATVSLEEVNKSAVLSTMASDLFRVGLNPRVALLAATAWVGAIDYIEEDMDTFLEALLDGLEITSIEVRDAPEQPDDVLDGNEIMVALYQSGYIVFHPEPASIDREEYYTMGDRYQEIISLRTEAYRPAPASNGVERRFGYAPVKYSNLFKEAIHALESNEYTVDEYMLSIAKQVIAQTGGMDEDKEAYVIKGCDEMSPDQAYVSEFKGDRRLRAYQASCHGPNGQSSDRSRALMDLAGVTMDYDVEVVLPVLKAEMGDMVTVKDSESRAQLIKDAINDPVAFVIKHIGLKESAIEDTIVSKPYSFVKAARLLVGLVKGERPYLGMACGLDAKCSGPQLGALMVGDQAIAQACGFSMEKVEDAYHRAIAECEKAGFHGLDRDNDIKKPFMGVFYGQGWRAFMDMDNLSLTCWNIVHGGEFFGSEDKAKAFHKAITASFGMKMQSVRNAIKAYAGKTDKRTKHYMPDGSEVAMNYKQKVNVLGEAMEYDTPTYDVYLNNNAESYKFINFQLKTAAVHVGDFARNGFVNMIQATDALLARLIIVHLKRMGAQHIICVHDCFRVNMTEMHILEAAIKQAYMDLFGNTKNERTEDLPMGTDILGLYFDGANKALIEGSDETYISQFFSSGTRRLMKIGGERLPNLIKSLGQTYYFAK
jgi:hypothetical protein